MYRGLPTNTRAHGRVAAGCKIPTAVGGCQRLLQQIEVKEQPSAQALLLSGQAETRVSSTSAYLPIAGVTTSEKVGDSVATKVTQQRL